MLREVLPEIETAVRAGVSQVVILEELRTGGSYVAPGELAALYTALGRRERAFALLEEAYARHDPQLQYLIIEPGFESLRGDPRYGVLLERVGLRN